MIDWFEPDLSQAIATAMIHSIWHGLAITCLLSLCTYFGLFKNSTQRYIWHLTGLFVLFLSAAFTFLGQFWAGAIGNVAQVTGTVSAIPFISGEITGVRENGVIWHQYLTLAWLAGLVFFMIKHIGGTLQLWTTVRRAIIAPLHWSRRCVALGSKVGARLDIRLKTSHEVTVPFVFGFLRPVIVFPANYYTQLAPAQIEAILLHELAHIRRYDFILNLAQLIVESMLFFNPASWWLANKIRRYREYCCDDVVQTRVPDTRVYLEALFNVAQMSQHQPRIAISLFNKHSELVMRVSRMSGNGRHRSPRSLILAMIGLMVTFALVAFNAHDAHNSEPVKKTVTPVTLKMPVIDQPDGQVKRKVRLQPMPKLKPRMARLMTDTVPPPSEEMLRLQREIEQKAEEIEELTEDFEEAIEEGIEEEMEAIEALGEEMEALGEKLEEEYENSPELRRLEEVGEMIEEQMEALQEKLEASLNSELIERLQEEMEEVGEKYEEEDLSEREKEQLQLEMQKLSQQLEAEVREFRQVHEQMRSEEMQKLQAEMEELHRAHAGKTNDLHHALEMEMRELHDQMQIHQQAVQAKMEGMNNQLHDQLHAKTMEIQDLQRQLEEATRKWREEHKNKGN